MFLELAKIDKDKIAHLRFKKLNTKVLITNDVGEYSYLSPPEFESFLNGRMNDIPPDKFIELQNKSFIRDKLDFDSLVQKYARKNLFLREGPSLHIMIVTLRCDHKCIYCQTKAKNLDMLPYDMDIPTAERIIDKIFEFPNNSISIELQGGEPLANWQTVKFIVDYANRKNKKFEKDMRLLLVSNLSFMTKEKARFLIENNVGICTSLDGPEHIHNNNRIKLTKGSSNSYKNTIKGLKVIKKGIISNKEYKYRINALSTITKLSLLYPKEIIDKYLELGLEGIHLRPVSPFGAMKDNKKIWRKINFSAEEFCDFYKKSLDYIIELNMNGTDFYERTAKIFLTKILTQGDPNYLDIRSPCGAGIGQLAYNFNGDVYPCDEARMLASDEDNTFRIGDINSLSSPGEFINNKTTKSIVLASCLDSIPVCSDCVYKPYCGICPMYNYITEQDIFSQAYQNERCRTHMFILDFLFDKLQDAQIKNIFDKWVKL